VNCFYGDLQRALHNAHYAEYCLMPFHVTEGITGRLIATVLRAGKTPTKEAGATRSVPPPRLPSGFHRARCSEAWRSSDRPAADGPRQALPLCVRGAV
jgi:hypothetical protein